MERKTLTAQMYTLARYAVLPIAALLFSSCASTQITPKPGQTVFYQNGSGVVQSDKPATAVAVRPIGKDESGRIQFEVAVINKGRTAFNVGMENITATSLNAKRLRVYTREDLERQARTRAALQAVAVGLNAGAQSFAASQPTTTTYSGTYAGNSNYHVHNQYGSHLGSVHGTRTGFVQGTATTHNPAQAAMAQQAIQANTAASVAGIQAGLAQSLQMAQSVFAMTTVLPGAAYAGLVPVKRSQEINLQIRTGGELHQASFQVK